MRLTFKVLLGGGLLLALIYHSILSSKYQISSLPFVPRDLASPHHDASSTSRNTGMAATVAVVGTGLAGLSAAYELSQRLRTEIPEARILVFEKNPTLGGNSMKASSGINAVNPAAGDTQQTFSSDTIKSGGGISKEDLVAQLVSNSEDGLAFLGGFGLNLSSIVRLGGHSIPRTHSNSVGPNVGLYLVKGVSSRVKEATNVEIKTNTKVTSVEQSDDGKFSISYITTTPNNRNSDNKSDMSNTAEAAGASSVVVDALVLATGGFAASKEMILRYCPSVAPLPTTNGAWSQGEGIQLGAALGAKLIHMKHVQVHPTGFVDPGDPANATKWLAPEKLRGCGAILLNRHGSRFVDELTTRDKVTADLMQQDGQVAWIVLGDQGANMFGEGTLGFYASKNMITKCDNLAAAAQHMQVPAEHLQQQLERYNTAAAAAAAGGRGDEFGKQYFPTTFDTNGHLWVGQITPVVHYCMGGLEINEKAQVLSEKGTPIKGLFAAGEVSGGLHGANRLGGNSLAECVVFGRIAGQRAAAHVLPRIVVHKGAGMVVDMMNSDHSVAAAM